MKKTCPGGFECTLQRHTRFECTLSRYTLALHCGVLDEKSARQRSVLRGCSLMPCTDAGRPSGLKAVSLHKRSLAVSLTLSDIHTHAPGEPSAEAFLSDSAEHIGMTG